MPPDHSPRPKPLCEIETQSSDGRPICLRTIRPSDQQRIREGITDMSDRSRYLRFFSAFREPPESIVKRLSAVDGHDHIGWGAILLNGDDNPPIAAAHAIRLDIHATTGELAIAVLDDYQGLGIARMLIAAVLCDCLDEGIDSLEMQVMAENSSAKSLVRALGAERMAALDSVEHYTLDVTKTLDRLRSAKGLPGIAQILSELLA